MLSDSIAVASVRSGERSLATIRKPDAIRRMVGSGETFLRGSFVPSMSCVEGRTRKADRTNVQHQRESGQRCPGSSVRTSVRQSTAVTRDLVEETRIPSTRPTHERYLGVSRVRAARFPDVAGRVDRDPRSSNYDQR